MKRVLAILFALVMIISLASCGKSQGPNNDVDYYKPINKGESILDFGDDKNPSESIDDVKIKIIKNAVVSSETKEFDNVYTKLKEKVNELGGRFSKASVSNRNSYLVNQDLKYLRYGDFEIRIPQDKYEQLLNGVEGIVTVTSMSENETDVTSEYVDTQARLKTMEAQRDALYAMLEKATTVSDMLSIQKSLYSVIADCEAYQARLNQIDDKASYSTIRLYVTEVREYTAPREETFFDRIAKAFGESWKDFANGWGNFVVFLVAAFPTLLIIAAIGVGVFFIVKGIVKKHKKVKAPKEEKDSTK